MNNEIPVAWENRKRYMKEKGTMSMLVSLHYIPFVSLVIIPVQTTQDSFIEKCWLIYFWRDIFVFHRTELIIM